MTLVRNSPCKVNLLLNILGKRADGFHELETVLQPVHLFDQLTFSRLGQTIELTCNNPSLPVDESNLVFRAALVFRKETGINEGIRIHLEKILPLAAGLGGGSGNAAITLLALNELWDLPLSPAQLHRLATSLGSDVPFFLSDQPALGLGRGERITPLNPFPALHGLTLVLIHPGFGVPTSWAYQNLSRFPLALCGEPGRAQKLIARLESDHGAEGCSGFYNSLEAPVLAKYPLLALFQDLLRSQGAVATMMSGSGSTTFALMSNRLEAENAIEKTKAVFGSGLWTAIVPVE